MEISLLPKSCATEIMFDGNANFDKNQLETKIALSSSIKCTVIHRNHKPSALGRLKGGRAGQMRGRSHMTRFSNCPIRKVSGRVWITVVETKSISDRNPS